jgi:radical SAM superfamily enzyme YgiQ (UPF0313 family)
MAINKTQSADSGMKMPGEGIVLLALLPFWTPLIPPMGIASLKRYLEDNGYTVRTIDATTEERFKELYDRYFGALKEFVTENKRGNFYNVGHDVMQNHMMAYMHRTEEHKYRSLVKELIKKIFYTEFDDRQVAVVTEIVAEIYRRLEDYIDRLIEKEKPYIFGLTVHIHTLPASLFAFRRVKEKYPHIKTVMGGGIFTEQLSVGSENLAYFQEKIDYIDKILVGEGEVLLLKYLQGELEEQKRIYTSNDIEGENLDFTAKKLPDLSDFKLEYYPSLAASGSVSCPFQCRFCSETVYFGKYRKKNARQTMEEMIQMYRLYGRQLFNMSDSLLNPIITELADAFIESGVILYWDGCLRVGNAAADVENTLHWRRGGFYGANLGIESGAQAVLDLMGKRITVEQSKKTLQALAYAGIKTTTYWVIGYPGETEEHFQQTLDFVEELKDDIYQAESHPFQFLNGLVNYDGWANTSPVAPLYPRFARDMLVIQTNIIRCEPPREEIYRRLNRFVGHCTKMGIPNVYSERDQYMADERWAKMHPNAVPAMIKFKDTGRKIEECRQIGNVYRSQKIDIDDGEFIF